MSYFQGISVFDSQYIIGDSENKKHPSGCFCGNTFNWQVPDTGVFPMPEYLSA